MHRYVSNVLLSNLECSDYLVIATIEQEKQNKTIFNSVSYLRFTLRSSRNFICLTANNFHKDISVILLCFDFDLPV